LAVDACAGKKASMGAGEMRPKMDAEAIDLTRVTFVT